MTKFSGRRYHPPRATGCLFISVQDFSISLIDRCRSWQKLLLSVTCLCQYPSPSPSSQCSQGSELRSLCLHSKCFARWVISLQCQGRWVEALIGFHAGVSVYVVARHLPLKMPLRCFLCLVFFFDTNLSWDLELIDWLGQLVSSTLRCVCLYLPVSFLLLVLGVQVWTASVGARHPVSDSHVCSQSKHFTWGPSP